MITTSQHPYCTIAQVQDRMLITSSDGTYNTSITLASNEASDLIDIFLKPYTTVPIDNSSNVNGQIQSITADFAASIFKRRIVPDEAKIRGAMQSDQINEIDASGWFALAMSKLERYIKSYYTLAQTIGNSVYNVDLFTNLFSKGIITGMEARAFINNATVQAINRIDNVTKTLNETITHVENDTVTKNLTTRANDTKVLSETDNITKTLGTTESLVGNETVSSYRTKRQNRFSFIGSDPDNESGYKQEGT